MSYDYLLFRVKQGTDPQCAVDAGRFESLGSMEDLMQTISSALPHVRWRAAFLPNVRMGGPAPEFLINTESDGQVRSFTMSRATEQEVLSFAKSLDLTVLDMQSGEVVGVHDSFKPKPPPGSA